MSDEEEPSFLLNGLSIEITVDCSKWYDLEFDFILHVKKVAYNVFNFLNVNYQSSVLSVLLTDDLHMQYLNGVYKNTNKPTGILSFCYDDSDSDFVMNHNESYNHEVPCNGLGTGLHLSDYEKNIGDIAISYDYTYKESMEMEKSFKEHFTHMLIHGILHVLGYDHSDGDNAYIMEDIESKIMSQFGYVNPY